MKYGDLREGTQYVRAAMKRQIIVAGTLRENIQNVYQRNDVEVSKGQDLRSYGPSSCSKFSLCQFPNHYKVHFFSLHWNEHNSSS